MNQPEHPPKDLRPKTFHGGFLKALLKDASANTLAIGAASMVPLLAMVGGAVDTSRFYMAETRMQAACDAGALAARRAMADDTFQQEHQQIGENFFDQNFEDGMFGITNQSRSFAGNPAGEVIGNASGVLPTSLMGIFGYGEFNMAVSCTADINISNTDIMFVVDVTGSMAWRPDGSNCGSSGGFWNECSDSRMSGLRDAVITFYDTVTDATSPSAQVRYGMVPYASNVNVGKAIVDANPAWMASDAVFQSRWAKFEETIEWNEIGQQVIQVSNRSSETYLGVLIEVDTFVSSQAACIALIPEAFTDQIRTDLGTHQGENNQRIEGNFRYTSYDDDNETLWRGSGGYGFTSSTGRCRTGWFIYEYEADVTFEIIEELETNGVQFDKWIYAEIDTANPPGATNPAGSPPGWEAVDLTSLYDSTPQVSVPLGGSGAMTTVTWDGCITEADTVASTTFDPVPAGALDLDINLVPDSQATRWKPVLRDATWERRDGGGSRTLSDVGSDVRPSQDRPTYSCSAPAFRLRDISRDDLQTYVNSLQPDGSTYHDIGMLWGARFISPRGIFQSSNAAAPNGDAIARHIVYLTDGELAPNIETYGTYGVEWWSRRVSGDANETTLFDAHAARFQAACRLARQENISVWVVAFGTALTQNLIDCATPGRSFAAADSDQLEDRFREIAQQIAALRLTN